MLDLVPDYLEEPSQRTPCLLVLDISGSMNEIVPATGRRRIDDLNQGLLVLQQELIADDTAASRVQIAIICVGGPASQAHLLVDWSDVAKFKPPSLQADGPTPLGKGMQMALQQVERQKQQLRNSGIGYTRPWIMVISDGEPTDSAPTWTEAVRECRSAEKERRCVIFPIGVGGANLSKLQELSATPAIRMSDARFGEYFQWLSCSLSSLSRSRPGDQVQLPAPNPWALVSA